MSNKVFTILLATKNNHKVKEIKDIISRSSLKSFVILSLNDINETIEVEEDGSTFEENSYIKAIYYANKYPYLVVSDDTGLMVDALDGNPGVKSKRYSEPNPTSEKNRQKLLHEMKSITNRNAHFKCSICLIDGADSEKTPYYFIGESFGEILESPIGDQGFGYDSLFYSFELNKAFAEATLEEKASVSHRGKALNNLINFLEMKYGK